MDKNVEKAVDAIENMAKTMREYSEEMQRVAESMRQSNDLSEATDALSCVSNMVANLRMDTLLARCIQK